MPDPLAYMTAKSHGLEDECQSILEASGLTEDQVSMPTMGKPLTPPKPIVPTFRSNWPTKATSTTVFEDALLGQGEDEVPATNGFAEEPELLADAEQNGDFAAEEEVEDAAGWDMGDDVPVEPEEGDFVHVEGPESGVGSSEADIWSRTSPIAADHVAGGSFESAMQLLSRQVGAVNFEPLKPRFEEIYQASRTFLPANASMPPLINYVRRTVDEIDPRRIQPIIPRNLEYVSSTEVTAGKKAMQGNKLEDGVKAFKDILHLLLVNAVDSQSEVAEVCTHLVLQERDANKYLGPTHCPRSRSLRTRHVHRARAKIAYWDKSRSFISTRGQEETKSRVGSILHSARSGWRPSINHLVHGNEHRKPQQAILLSTQLRQPDHRPKQ